MIKRLSHLLCLMLGLAAVLPGPARAKSLYSVPDEVITLRMMEGWRNADGTHMAALHIRLKDGWKTYWRAPGDGGIPPQFNWSASRNLTAARILWPRPEVLSANGMRTIGYTQEVILPIELTPAQPGKRIMVKGEVELGVCKDICMPMTLRFDAELPVGRDRPSGAIMAAIADQPMTAERAGVSGVTCSVAPIKDGLRLTAAITMPAIDQGEVVVIEAADPAIWVSEAAAQRAGPVLTAVAELVGPSNTPFALDRSSLRFTVLGDRRAVDIRGCTGG